MLPSSSCKESVKLRHRNVMTTTTTRTVELSPAKGQRNNKNTNPALSKENCSGDSYSKQPSGFFSNLSRSEHQCYMTHRRQQTLSESSDGSVTNEAEIIGDHCSKYVKKSSFNSATMRPNDVQRQASSMSQMGNSVAVGSGCNRIRAFNTFIEVAIRLILFASFVIMERSTPFKRIIQPEEVWLYNNPISADYVSPLAIILAVIFAPMVLIILSYIIQRDGRDFSQACFAFTLATVLNGFMTSLIKISVGRPRPDFFYRCYPDGVSITNNLDQCTGDPLVVNEGRKSFPSGHSSMAFAAFGFMSFFLASKLNIFNERGRGRTWRLIVSIAPLVVATEVAISRTCDYHHHWQDVVIGSLLGICISYLCYRQYYPSIFARNCHRPYPRNGPIKANQVDYVPDEVPEDLDESHPLIVEPKDNKWI